LVTEPLDGATNMAVDEALLRGRITGEAPPTVRFYGWRPPTVSVGYGQPLDGRLDLEACRRLGIGLVRRPTGGSAILHEASDHEVTYSVVARAEDAAGFGDVLETYRILGAALAAGLGRLGVHAEVVPLVRAGRRGAAPTFCFARAGAYELAVEGRKLSGSAQRRQGGAFLQHGSVVLDVDPDRLRAVFPGPPESPRPPESPGPGDPLAGMTTLAAVLGRRVGFEAVVIALAEGLGEGLGARLRPGGLSPAETELIERLVLEKYGTEAWTVRGEAPPAAGASSPALSLSGSGISGGPR